jgi:hypothetical protein
MKSQNIIELKREIQKNTNGKQCLPNQILLTFDDEGSANYVRLLCRRTGIALETYILDNFEWDDQPECFSDFGDGEAITKEICNGCSYSDICPDAVK